MSSIQLGPLGFTLLFQLLLNKDGQKNKIRLRRSINTVMRGLELLLRCLTGLTDSNGVNMKKIGMLGK